MENGNHRIQKYCTNIVLYIIYNKFNNIAWCLKIHKFKYTISKNIYNYWNKFKSTIIVS